MARSDEVNCHTEATVLVPPHPEIVLRWLTDPELMVRWMVGIERVELAPGPAAALGARTTVTTVPAGGILKLEMAFHGEILEIGPTRLVRRYEMAGVSAGPVSVTDNVAYEYTRHVVYDLTPAGPQCELRGTVTTALVNGRVRPKAEQASLVRSLQTLAAAMAGSAPERIRHAHGLTPQPL